MASSLQQTTGPLFSAIVSAHTTLATAARYPELRYMGSKHRLLPWVFEILSGLDFNLAMDPFSGSGCVAYLLKCMGKRVIASDYLEFATTLAKATVENGSSIIDGPALKKLLSKRVFFSDLTGEPLQYLIRSHL
jgi:hypothetical protein